MSHKQPSMGQGRPDDFQTPPIALFPLLPYLKPGSVVWECAAGRGNLANDLERRGYSVIRSDILTNKDFLKWQPLGFDYIVTNPPFTLKQQFLARCYALGKPFALLLPLTALETPKRQALFQEHGLEIIFFDKRINFETPSGKGAGSWFATAWFTWGLGIGREMTFHKIHSGAVTLPLFAQTAPDAGQGRGG